MSDTRTSTDAGLEVVVGSDGVLVVPAAELVSHGLEPGDRVRLVPVRQPTAAERKRMAGAFAGSVLVGAVEELLQNLDQAKAERVTRHSQNR